MRLRQEVEAVLRRKTVNWEDALEIADEILDMIDNDLPEEAEEFAESVEEKVRDIRNWIEDHRHVTERQVEALENMKRGCEKWMD